MSPFFAILTTLCLFDAAALPGGVFVTRVSLFGYQLGAEVLELEEAAAHAETLASPMPDPEPVHDPLRIERSAEDRDEAELALEPVADGELADAVFTPDPLDEPFLEDEPFADPDAETPEAIAELDELAGDVEPDEYCTCRLSVCCICEGTSRAPNQKRQSRLGSCGGCQGGVIAEYPTGWPELTDAGRRALASAVCAATRSAPKGADVALRTLGELFQVAVGTFDHFERSGAWDAYATAGEARLASLAEEEAAD